MRTRAFIIAACVIGSMASTGFGKNPVTAQDVAKERQLFTAKMCRQKIQAHEFAMAMDRPKLAEQALKGCSAVENELGKCQADEMPLPNIKAPELPGIIRNSLRRWPHKQVVLIKLPKSFNGTAYIDRFNQPHPEEYFPNSTFGKSVLVLHPKGSIEVPAILEGNEIMEYLRTRDDEGFKPGSYYANLHQTRITLKKLAELRYFDYADSRPEKREVPVYVGWYYPASDTVMRNSN